MSWRSRSPPASSSASARTAADRIDALEAIADAHRRHGHVQEVIVQNFLPKAGTAMHTAPPCPADDYLEAIALARLILPPEVHLQAPPNLSDDFGVLLDAGIDDWGGVSPVTADHVNPERPWPALDRLAAVTEAAGFVLGATIDDLSRVRPRSRALAATPICGSPVMDRSDAEGLGRDDPGAVFPEKVEFVRQGDDGADVEVIGDRSTQWYSGADVDPPMLVRHRRPRTRRRREPSQTPCDGAAPSPRCSPACSTARRSASTRSSRCSAPAAPRCCASPRSPTSCAAR